MDYRLPTLEDKVDLQDYLDECSAIVEQSVMLHQDLFEEDYPAWVATIERYAREGNADWGRSLFLLCRDGGDDDGTDGELVGLLCIRYELTPELEAIYEHIGYSVRPSKRKRGYATQMLQHALDVCRDLGLESVTLGCYKANVASAAVMKKCGGILVAENENYTEGQISQYYEIRLV